MKNSSSSKVAPALRAHRARGRRARVCTARPASKPVVRARTSSRTKTGAKKVAVAAPLAKPTMSPDKATAPSGDTASGEGHTARAGIGDPADAAEVRDTRGDGRVHAPTVRVRGGACEGGRKPASPAFRRSADGRPGPQLGRRRRFEITTTSAGLPSSEPNPRVQDAERDCSDLRSQEVRTLSLTSTPSAAVLSRKEGGQASATGHGRILCSNGAGGDWRRLSCRMSPPRDFPQGRRSSVGRAADS